MAMKPLPTSRSRDATSPADPGGRAVTSSKGAESPAQKEQGAQPGGAGPQRRPREQRELDEQRRALAKLVLGVFEVQADTEAALPPADAAAQPGSATAPRPMLDPRLEQAILEFMYALFDALDQIDDAEPTLTFGVAGQTAAPVGRSAFGERIDLLAGRIAALPPAAVAPASGGYAASLSAGLELAYLAVLRVFNADAAAPAEPGLLRQALAALLRRLANAMHVAPTLGYGTSGNAGALLRVRA